MKARLEKGLRQVDVDEAIGVGENTIANGGKLTDFPRRYTKVQRLCGLFGMYYSSVVETLGPASKRHTESFGAALTMARLMAGLTQERTARLAGIDPGTLASWEKSRHVPP
jgi:hypothetical protein